MKENLGGNKVVVSHISENPLNVFKNHKKITLILLSILIFLTLWLLVGLYIRTTYAFIIGGKFYSKSEINHLTTFPRSIDNKTDYYNLAFQYYKYVSVANSLNMYISEDLYNRVRSNLISEYNLSSSSTNSWIDLESKYLTIKNYINTNSLRPISKSGFVCVFYSADSISIPNTVMLNAIDKIKSSISFNKDNYYSITNNKILTSDEIKLLNNSLCSNFGFGPNQWSTDVQATDVINKIFSTNKKGITQNYLGNNEGSPYYYFFNLINNKDYPNINLNNFNTKFKNLGSTYYGK